MSRYNDPRNGSDHANAVAASPDGAKVFVTGNSAGLPSAHELDFLTIGYDAVSGATVWVRRHEGPGHREDSACCVAVSPDGSMLFVTGYVTPPGGGTDVETIAYAAADGRMLWTTSHGGSFHVLPGAVSRPLRSDFRTPSPYGTVPRSIAVSPDGSQVFVSGATSGRFLVIAYSAVDGQVDWVRIGGWDTPGAARSIGVSPDGTVVFMTGGSTRHTGAPLTQARDAATGDLLWTSTFAGDGTQMLAVSPYGERIYVSGFDQGPNSSDYVTIAYDASTGTQKWLARYDSISHQSDDPFRVAVSPDDRLVFVTGRSQGSTVDYATVAYVAATGRTHWVRRYNGPANSHDAADAIAVSPDGSRVFVTGRSPGLGTNEDYATIAYDSETGTRLWFSRYDGPPSGPDLARSIALSPDGARVYVTGSSLGFITGSDFATVAYDNATSPAKAEG